MNVRTFLVWGDMLVMYFNKVSWNLTTSFTIKQSGHLSSIDCDNSNIDLKVVKGFSLVYMPVCLSHFRISLEVSLNQHEYVCPDIVTRGEEKNLEGMGANARGVEQILIIFGYQHIVGESFVKSTKCVSFFFCLNNKRCFCFRIFI